MLTWPQYPNGKNIEVGDLYSWDGDTKHAIVLLIYPLEATYPDDGITDREKPSPEHKVPNWMQIQVYELGIKSVVALDHAFVSDAKYLYNLKNCHAEYKELISTQDYPSILQYWEELEKKNH